MKRSIAATLLALALVTPIATVAGVPTDNPVEAPQHTPLHLEPHPSILIAGDEGFSTPGNGVRSGSGTADDPYVISGWAIIQDRHFGIRLVDTEAHVVIENVRINGIETLATTPLDCIRHAASLCTGNFGIELQGAENVTIRDVRVLQANSAIRISDAQNVHVANSHLGYSVDNRLYAWLGDGVLIRGSTHVMVENITTHAADLPVRVSKSAHVTVVNSSFQGPGFSVPVADSENITILWNEFHQVEILGSGDVTNLTVAENRFLGGESAVHIFGIWDRGHSVKICGNHIENMTDTAINLIGDDILVQGNRILNSSMALRFSLSEDVRLENNLISNMADKIARIGAAHFHAHNNAFTDTDSLIEVLYGPTDFTHNWWGDSSGPSGLGQGEGAALDAPDGTPYAPWLTEAPNVHHDCMPDFRIGF